MNPYHQGQLDFFCAVYAFINAMRLLFGVQLGQARDILATTLSDISAHPALWQAMLQNRTDHHWVMPYMLGRFCGPGGLGVRIARLPERPFRGLADAGEQEITSWLNLQAPQEVLLNSLNAESLYRPDVEFGPSMLPPGESGPQSRPWRREELWPLLQGWLPSKKFMGVFGVSQRQKRCLVLRFHRFLAYQHTPLISHWSTGHDFSKDSLNLYDCTANKEATHTLPLAETALYPEDIGGRRKLALEPQSLYFLEKI